jgi:hypothetical protein
MLAFRRSLACTWVALGAATCSQTSIVTARTRATSPDGEWIAEARTERWTARSDSALHEVVLLRSATTSRRVKVLDLDESENRLPIDVQLAWVGARTLVINYSQPAVATLQMVRSGDITIVSCGPTTVATQLCSKRVK